MRQFEFSPHEPLAHAVACGTVSGGTILADQTTGKVVGHWPGQTIGDPVLALCWHPQQHHLFASASSKGVIKLFDARNALEATALPADLRAPLAPLDVVQSFPLFPRLTCVHISSDGSQLLTSGYSRLVSICDVGTGSEVRVLRAVHTEHINIARFAHSSPHLLATCSSDRTSKVFDLRQAEARPVAIMRSSGGHITLSWSPDDTKILTSAVDNEVRQWLAGDGRPLGRVDLPASHVSTNYTRAYYADGGASVVAGSSEEGVVRVNSAHTGEPLRTISLLDGRQGAGVYVQSLRGHPTRTGHVGVITCYRDSTQGMSLWMLDSDPDRMKDAGGTARPGVGSGAQMEVRALSAAGADAMLVDDDSASTASDSDGDSMESGGEAGSSGAQPPVPPPSSHTDTPGPSWFGGQWQTLSGACDDGAAAVAAVGCSDSRYASVATFDDGAHCTVTPVVSCFSVKVPPSPVRRTLGPSGADVTLVTSPILLPRASEPVRMAVSGHRAVLAARVPLFRRLLETVDAAMPAGAPAGPVMLNLPPGSGITPQVLATLLTYAYTDAYIPPALPACAGAGLVSDGRGLAPSLSDAEWLPAAACAEEEVLRFYIGGTGGGSLSHAETRALLISGGGSARMEHALCRTSLTDAAVAAVRSARSYGCSDADQALARRLASLGPLAVELSSVDSVAGSSPALCLFPFDPFRPPCGSDSWDYVAVKSGLKARCAPAAGEDAGVSDLDDVESPLASGNNAGPRWSWQQFTSSLPVRPAPSHIPGMPDAAGRASAEPARHSPGSFHAAPEQSARLTFEPALYALVTGLEAARVGGVPRLAHLAVSRFTLGRHGAAGDKGFAGHLTLQTLLPALQLALHFGGRMPGRDVEPRLGGAIDGSSRRPAVPPAGMPLHLQPAEGVMWRLALGEDGDAAPGDAAVTAAAATALLVACTSFAVSNSAQVEDLYGGVMQQALAPTTAATTTSGASGLGATWAAAAIHAASSETLSRSSLHRGNHTDLRAFSSLEILSEPPSPSVTRFEVRDSDETGLEPPGMGSPHSSEEIDPTVLKRARRGTTPVAMSRRRPSDSADVTEAACGAFTAPAPTLGDALAHARLLARRCTVPLDHDTTRDRLFYSSRLSQLSQALHGDPAKREWGAAPVHLPPLYRHGGAAMQWMTPVHSHSAAVVSGPVGPSATQCEGVPLALMVFGGSGLTRAPTYDAVPRLACGAVQQPTLESKGASDIIGGAGSGDGAPPTAPQSSVGVWAKTRTYGNRPVATMNHATAGLPAFSTRATAGASASAPRYVVLAHGVTAPHNKTGPGSAGWIGARSERQGALHGPAPSSSDAHAPPHFADGAPYPPPRGMADDEPWTWDAEAAAGRFSERGRIESLASSVPLSREPIRHPSALPDTLQKLLPHAKVYVFDSWTSEWRAVTPQWDQPWLHYTDLWARRFFTYRALSLRRYLDDVEMDAQHQEQARVRREFQAEMLRQRAVQAAQGMSAADRRIHEIGVHLALEAGALGAVESPESWAEPWVRDMVGSNPATAAEGAGAGAGAASAGAAGPGGHTIAQPPAAPPGSAVSERRQALAAAQAAIARSWPAPLPRTAHSLTLLETDLHPSALPGSTLHYVQFGGYSQLEMAGLAQTLPDPGDPARHNPAQELTLNDVWILEVKQPPSAAPDAAAAGASSPAPPPPADASMGFRWYRPVVWGEAPPRRLAHTATSLPLPDAEGGPCIVVFGGITTLPLGDMHVLAPELEDNDDDEGGFQNSERASTEPAT